MGLIHNTKCEINSEVEKKTIQGEKIDDVKYRFCGAVGAVMLLSLTISHFSCSCSVVLNI